MLTVRPAPGETIRELAARLERDPRVVAVEPESQHALRGVPNDPAMSQPDRCRRSPTSGICTGRASPPHGT